MNSTTRLMTLAIAGVVSASAFAQVTDIPATAHLQESFPVSGTPQVFNPQATMAYDNIQGSAYSGFVLSNTGAAGTITRMVGDDVKTRIYAWGKDVNRFWFSVSNLDTVAFTAPPRVRFYRNNGAGGGPGTYIIGYSFNPINFNPGTVNTFFTDITTAGQFVLPADGNMWACMTFDNASGSTATLANLDQLGQALFNPPALGSSQNLGWISTAAGSFVQNDPPGATFTFSTPPPVMNVYWGFQTTLDPVTATGQILFNNYVAATPSSVNFQWYDTSSNLVAQQVEAVDPAGNFVADTPATAGVYQMSMKTGTWLRRTLTIDTTAGNVTGLVFNLVNGDANNDNFINSDDFDILVANFGGPGPDGDFDGSGSVDSDDFDILVANFGTDGDGP
ncbi:MAG TPA: hypothetical protein PLH94_05595 [Fimbriimonadaceae bacterium]|nr:hypothetical protein [Fimbriimonadaceae bacterium]